MGPEESMRIQSHLASTISMAFDECVENPAEHSYSKASCERTTRWLERCIAEQKRLNASDDTINKNQLLFGINQGCTYDDLRVEHMKRIREFDYCSGFAIGGLAVGEPTEVMYHIIEQVEPFSLSISQDILGAWEHLPILLRLYTGALISLTALCQAVTQDMQRSSLGTELCMLKINAMSLMKDHLILNVIALHAVIFREHIFVTCLKRMNSLLAAGCSAQPLFL